MSEKKEFLLVEKKYYDGLVDVFNNNSPFSEPKWIREAYSRPVPEWASYFAELKIDGTILKIKEIPK